MLAAARCWSTRKAGRWSERAMGGDLSDLRPISLAPPAEPALRHAARLIAMVHEIHKAGYQRIRMCPAMAPSGVHWRCSISHADNVDDDGLGFRPGGEGEIALYSSGQGALYFGWEDGEGLTARLMAARFLERFQIIAGRGAGRDRAYAR